MMPIYWNDDCMPDMLSHHDGHESGAAKLALDLQMNHSYSLHTQKLSLSIIIYSTQKNAIRYFIMIFK